MLYQLIPVLASTGIFGLYALWQCIKYEPRSREDITDLITNITPQDTPFMRSLKEH